MSFDVFELVFVLEFEEVFELDPELVPLFELVFEPVFDPVLEPLVGTQFGVVELVDGFVRSRIEKPPVPFVVVVAAPLVPGAVPFVPDVLGVDDASSPEKTFPMERLAEARELSAFGTIRTIPIDRKTKKIKMIATMTIFNAVRIGFFSSFISTVLFIILGLIWVKNGRFKGYFADNVRLKAFFGLVLLLYYKASICQ